MRAPGRKQLIGFVAEERPDFVFPEGAALVEQAKIRRPYNSIGHISSCYFSPVLQRCFGLCLVRDGRQLVGQTGFVFVPGERRALMIRYCDPVFYDRSGHGSGRPRRHRPRLDWPRYHRLRRHRPAKQLDHEKERRAMRMRNASETNDGANGSANGGGHLGGVLSGAFLAQDGSFSVRPRPPEQLWLLRAKPKELPISPRAAWGLGSFPEPIRS